MERWFYRAKIKNQLHLIYSIRDHLLTDIQVLPLLSGADCQSVCIRLLVIRISINVILVGLCKFKLNVTPSISKHILILMKSIWSLCLKHLLIYSYNRSQLRMGKQMTLISD